MAILIRPAKRVRKARTKNSEEVLKRLEEYLNSSNVTGEPVEILCGFWKDQQNAISYQELRQAVQDGYIDQKTLQLWMQDYSVLVAGSLQSIWQDAFVAGSFSQPIMDGMAFSLDMQAPGILNWIDQHGAEFVTNCTQEQKDAIAALLTKKMRDSHTVDELSRLIRPCIGLTEGDAKAAARFYDNIVINMRKDHPRMKMESIRQKALDATQKYAEKKHRQRAMMIAQTESAFAYNQGADEGVRQAQAENLLGTVKKRWSSSGDENVCDMCNSLDGTEVEMDADFDIKGRILFAGHHLLPPAHPRCGCAVEYVEVEPPGHNLEVQNQDELAEVTYIGSLENTDDDMIKSSLETYEKQIAESSIENAVIITKDGLIWQCIGSKDAVLLDADMGIVLDGAYATHNHPIGSLNEYSFSKYDIDFFMENDLKILRGIDEKYIYELSRNPSMRDKHVSLEEMMISEGDLARHEHLICYAERLGIGYRRWRR